MEGSRTSPWLGQGSRTVAAAAIVAAVFECEEAAGEDIAAAAAFVSVAAAVAGEDEYFGAVHSRGSLRLELLLHYKKVTGEVDSEAHLDPTGTQPFVENRLALLPASPLESQAQPRRTIGSAAAAVGVSCKPHIG